MTRPRPRPSLPVPGVIFLAVQLMALQSHFRTDERFRMDARFLEDDEDREEDTGEAQSRLC